MKILVINCGSSSLKFKLLEMEQQEVLAQGLIDRIGLPKASISYQLGSNGQKVVEEQAFANQQQAVQKVINLLSQQGVIKNISEISGIGHRVAHGGSYYNEAVTIDESVKAKIKELCQLAPLHNQVALAGIEACQEAFPLTRQVAVFDTAFHQTIPEYAYIYGLPFEAYEKYGIRKYGFHGPSHKYVAERAATLAGKPLEKLKIITCHLGNGASLTALRYGKSIDTSMGFTPLEGLMMGTRSGDIDPAIVTFLVERENWSIAQANDYLNKKSGVLGVSGISSDFRDVEKAAAEGNHRAKLALEIFNYKLIKYIGAFVAVLNGVDIVAFTAGLGENSPDMRRDVCRNLEYLGLKLDEVNNNQRGKEAIISTADSSTLAMVIPTSEELMIARETQRHVL